MGVSDQESHHLSTHLTRPPQRLQDLVLKLPSARHAPTSLRTESSPPTTTFAQPFGPLALWPCGPVALWPLPHSDGHQHSCVGWIQPDSSPGETAACTESHEGSLRGGGAADHPLPSALEAPPCQSTFRRIGAQAAISGPLRAHDPRARARHLPGGQNRIRSPALIGQTQAVLAPKSSLSWKAMSPWGDTTSPIECEKL